MLLHEKDHTLSLCQRLLEDRSECSLYQSDDLFTTNPHDIDVYICESSEEESWKARHFKEEDDFLGALYVKLIVALYTYLMNSRSKWSPTEPDRSTIFILNQTHSRGRIQITPYGFEGLHSALGAFPALLRLLETFTPNETDYYLTGGRINFGHRSIGNWDHEKMLEMCCLLQHVERNGRTDGDLGWSIRVMGVHHVYDTNACAESLTLINPSSRVRSLLQRHLKTAADKAKPWLHWSFMPLLLFRSITSGWAEYTRVLHHEVFHMMVDSQFLNYGEPVKDAEDLTPGNMIITTEKIQKFAFLGDKIEAALHALRINRETLDAFLGEAEYRHRILPGTFRIELETLLLGLNDVRRELFFVEQQLDIIRFRLQQTKSCYRDVANMNDSHNMQRLTIKSMKEAYAVRIIALVTFLFLPPTFTCGFFEMQYVNVNAFSAGEGVNITTTPGLGFWAAITAPLMIVTVCVWAFFDHRIRNTWQPTSIKRDVFHMA